MLFSWEMKITLVEGGGQGRSESGKQRGQRGCYWNINLIGTDKWQFRKSMYGQGSSHSLSVWGLMLLANAAIWINVPQNLCCTGWDSNLEALRGREIIKRSGPRVRNLGRWETAPKENERTPLSSSLFLFDHKVGCDVLPCNWCQRNSTSQLESAVSKTASQKLAFLNS